MTISEIHNYYKERIKEINRFANSGPGDLWAFVMSACFIDFLVKMVYNKESKAVDYKNFIKDYLSIVNPLYRDFEYTIGNKKDLPEQMYHILRCGIIHSNSLVPDLISLKNNGRPRSIMLGQRRNNNQHFMKFDQNGIDTVIFTVEDFAEDLEKVLDIIFDDLLSKNATLEKNITDWVTEYPPIMQKTI